MNDSHWIERAQSAEAKNASYQEVIDKLKDKIRGLKETFGARELSDGQLDINYEKLVGQLDIKSALELRTTIDNMHRISGPAGEKPRIKMTA